MAISQWVKESVGYEIYPRSFYDGNGDGMGDIQGIIKKLDYLSDLGINLIWIGPFYPSPLDDNGYDVSDFMNVDPQLGTLADIKQLIQKAHQLGIRVMFDFVMNQTSDEHPWFIESCQNKNSEKRDYYIWQKGKSQNRPPTNWGSFFGGSAWKYDKQSDEYYMKIFSDKMPDLNWSNPKVRFEMGKVAKFWLDLGVDGFRMDAIAHLARDMKFVDSKKKKIDGVVGDWSKFSNRKELYTYLKQLHQEVFSQYNCLTIGEVGGGAKIKDALKYIPSIDMVFNFDACWCLTADNKVDVMRLKNTINYWITNSLKHGIYLPQYWLNHDHPRVMSQYGSQKYFKESGKALALLLLSLYGLPFIYNGEEIGMQNALYDKLSDFKDVSSQNYIKLNAHRLSEQEMLNHLRNNSRDHGHLPMQWTSEKYAGFSVKEPYLKVNLDYQKVNVAQQLQDKDSILNFYRQMIQLRLNSKWSEVLQSGDFELIESQHPQIFGFRRKLNNRSLLVLVNLSEQDTTYSVAEGEIIISNIDSHKPHSLGAYEGIIMREQE